MKLWKIAIPFALLVLAFGMTGCSSKTKKAGTDEPAMAAEADNSDLEINADSDSGNAGPLKTIYFGYNSAVLSGSAKRSLQGNVEFLKEMTAVEVQIEGHCDERGGVQYNLALGEKRAKSVKRYLVALGVDENRISTISFGKERPVSFGHDDDTWSKNRRGNFVITAK